MWRLLAVVLACLAVPMGAAAQQATIPRVGILSPGNPGPSILFDAFQRGLAELGYVEGRNVVLEYRFAGGRPERLEKLAVELVDHKVAVIVAVNKLGAQAAKRSTTTVPVVFTWSADAAGLVASLGRPGGNVTGLTTFVAELGGKRLEMLKSVLPGVARGAALWSVQNPNAGAAARDLEAAGAKLGIAVQLLGVRNANELDDAFHTASRNGAAFVFVIEDATLLPHRSRILELAARHRLPTASQYREFAEAGGLLSYGPNLPEQFRRAAVYVDKILRGARPGDLPVEQPAKLDLVINLKTARALGLTIAPSLLLRADQIIE
jgi:putative ABC transport system substrate-binding protein